MIFQDIKTILARLTTIATQGENIMATLQQIKDDLAAIKAAAEALIAGQADLKAKLAAALANVSIPADVQAQIDAAFADAESLKSELSKATA